LQILLQL